MVVVTTRMVIVRSGQLSEVQETIIELREKEANFKIASAQKDAGDANQQAGDANERAKKLENANLTLRGKVATLETEAAKQQERAANAEKSLTELRQSLADRDITPQQRERMLQVLRTKVPGHLVVQSLLSGGREAMEYGTKIAAIFKDAGWTVEPPNGRGAFGSPISGVFLVAGPNSDQETNFLANVLIAGNLANDPVGVSPSKNVANGAVEIWVASKPAR